MNIVDDRMRFRLMQDGMMVAGVEGPSLSAMCEAGHYRAVYEQDGPCTLQFYTKGKRWRDVREGELENAIIFHEMTPQEREHYRTALALPPAP